MTNLSVHSATRRIALGAAIAIGAAAIFAATALTANALAMIGTNGNDSTGDPITGAASSCGARTGFPTGSLAGDDVISGNDGIDCIMAGPGADKVNAGLSLDIVFGGSGNDLLNGNGGIDFIYGESGDDWIQYDPQYSICVGGGDADFLAGGWGNDQFCDGDGADSLRGLFIMDPGVAIGCSVPCPDDDRFILVGDGTVDHVYGYQGNDTVILNRYGGADTVDCGLGLDTVRRNGNSAAVLTGCETVFP